MLTRPALLILAGLLTLLCGCHPLSPQARQMVTPGLDLATVRAEPQKHVGATLLVGGNILGLMPQEEYSVIEVYSWNLDATGNPVSFDGPGGRFLAVTEKWFDPLVFAPGRFVTLVGTVEGSETVDLDGNDYTYPILRIDEIRAPDFPIRYYGPPRLAAVNPQAAPPWYELANPYDPTASFWVRGNTPP